LPNRFSCRTALRRTLPHSAALCRPLPHAFGRFLPLFAAFCCTEQLFSALRRIRRTLPHSVPASCAPCSCKLCPRLLQVLSTLPHSAALCRTLPRSAALSRIPPHSVPASCAPGSCKFSPLSRIPSHSPALCHTLPHSAALRVCHLPLSCSISVLDGCSGVAADPLLSAPAFYWALQLSILLIRSSCVTAGLCCQHSCCLALLRSGRGIGCSCLRTSGSVRLTPACQSHEIGGGYMV
jgi:hypothetical protein